MNDLSVISLPRSELVFQFQSEVSFRLGLVFARILGCSGSKRKPKWEWLASNTETHGYRENDYRNRIAGVSPQTSGQKAASDVRLEGREPETR